MSTTGDGKSGGIAIDQRPFIVSRPCPVCRGEGKSDEQACAKCYGTGAGLLFHGTKADLAPGHLIEAGHPVNFGKRDRTTAYVYLTGTLDAAVWGAELALGEGLGRVYTVEPTGPIEDDPNLTDKRYAGNPTKSYRSREPLRVTGEIMDWQGHSPDQLKAMREGLAQLDQQGLEPIED